MKKLFVLFALAAISLSAGCKKDPKEQEEEEYPVGGFEIAAVQYEVDADTPAAVETDLEATIPFPVGSLHQLSAEGTGNLWKVKSPDNEELAGGTFMWEELETIPSAIGLIAPPTQVITYRTMKIDRGGSELVYYVFIIKSVPETRRDMTPVYDLWFYEDLTAHYAGKYPEAGVRGVARVQQCKYRY